MFDFNPIYLMYLLIGVSAAMFAEGGYLLFYNKASYRKNINRRLKVMDDKPDRESVLVQLRRERGLTSGGEYRLPLVNLNQLLLQSGLSIGFTRLMVFVAVGMVAAFVGVMTFTGKGTHAFGAALFCGLVLPFMVLRFLRSRRQKKFGAQFPDAIDIIVRSLRAGHPVPVAINMVAREMQDPVGTEFGIVTDEVTYGADLETAMRNLFFRVGSDDLPLFVTAVAIQGSTGGNLGEILENLSAVIRQRFKMRPGRRRPRLGADFVVAADRHVRHHQFRHAAILRQRLGSGSHQNLPGAGRLLDGHRQFHHVPPRQLQDLTMETLSFALANVFRDNTSVLMALLVFLATGTIAFAAMAFVRVRGAVKRRTSRLMFDSDRAAKPERSLRYSSLKAVTQLLEYTTRHYADTNDGNMKVLRRRLIQAGIYDPRAVAYFFIARTALAIGLAGAMFIFVPMFASQSGSFFWLMVIVGGIAGYVGPSMYIDRRISGRKVEHRGGFPDFMDLLVVCADSGLSMEASLERVGRELGDSYPSLTANIHMTNLEIRAGRALKDALERFADRLALEEARSFATLINQSLDIGSSITDALRVYSDDMRHKRLSNAEEKAYALPAKLSLPMMICIFPVIFVVILLPVFVRLHVGNF
jgi:Flp pilus assembly protein TadB